MCAWKIAYGSENFQKVAAVVPLEKANRADGHVTVVGGCIGKWAVRLLAGSGPGCVGVTSWIAYHSKKDNILFYQQLQKGEKRAEESVGERKNQIC